MLRKLAPILLSLLLCTSVSAGINFDDASSQYLSGTNPFSAAPFTICAWFNIDDDTHGHTVVGVGDTAGNTNYWRMTVNNTAPEPVEFSIQAGAGTLDVISTTTGATAGTWHLGCIVATSSSSRDVYIDGGSAPTSATADRSPASIDTIRVGAHAINSITDFMSGDIAHVMIWDVALSSANIADLFVSSETGQAPDCVNSADLIRYWPLANSSDLTDTIGSQTLTANNSPTNSADDPTINQCATGNPFIWLQLVK